MMLSIESSRLRAQRAAERADDAGGHGIGQAERIADRDHELPGTQARRIPERCRYEFRRIDTQHRKIGMRIVADETSPESSRPSSSATEMRSASCTT